MASDDARALAAEVRRLAHDLNNALMPILLATSTIRLTAATGDASIAKRIDAIEQSARRASSIVEEIQAVARAVAPPEPGGE